MLTISVLYIFELPTHYFNDVDLRFKDEFLIIRTCIYWGFVYLWGLNFWIKFHTSLNVFAVNWGGKQKHFFEPLILLQQWEVIQYNFFNSFFQLGEDLQTGGTTEPLYVLPLYSLLSKEKQSKVSKKSSCKIKMWLIGL